MSGRFHDQRIIGVTLSREQYDDEAVSDDEDCAFIHLNTSTNRMDHDYALVEALREVRGDKVRRIHRVRIADLKAGNVEVLARVYEPVRDKKVLQKFKNDPRELYHLPIRSAYAYEWVSWRVYLTRVKMTDIGITGHYALEEESRREALKRCKEEDRIHRAQDKTPSGVDPNQTKKRKKRATDSKK